MENQRQKWVNLVFTGVAILFAWMVSVGLSKVSAVYNLESNIKQIDLIIRFGSLALGAGLGFGLYLNDRANAFMNEVVLEMIRVTWPGSKETTGATVWVVFFVLAASLLLGGFDSFCAWILN
ncbi:MAG: preprotein translocase subunit SecE [Proteobacteria bacterium]|nr:preprotein translocase subunit SecE [Pseudomonadota bacterium]